MASEHLGTYLNDHLAGAVAAIAVLEHLEKERAGTPLGQLVSTIKADVVRDREVLTGLMEKLDVRESRPRKAVGWLGERVTELKLRLDDPSAGAFRLLESLEIVTLGIEGKHGLWRALASAAARLPVLKGTDFARLAERAQEQRARLEPERIAAALAAFDAL
jgi:hypothetical protein